MNPVNVDGGSASAVDGCVGGSVIGLSAGSAGSGDNPDARPPAGSTGSGLLLVLLWFC